MSLSLLPLLVVEEDVPHTARVALHKAKTTSVETERRAYLVEAAHALFHEAHMDCDDARELVGLDP